MVVEINVCIGHFIQKITADVIQALYWNADYSNKNTTHFSKNITLPVNSFHSNSTYFPEVLQGAWKIHGELLRSHPPYTSILFYPGIVSHHTNLIFKHIQTNFSRFKLNIIINKSEKKFADNIYKIVHVYIYMRLHTFSIFGNTFKRSFYVYTLDSILRSILIYLINV